MDKKIEEYALPHVKEILRKYLEIDESKMAFTCKVVTGFDGEKIICMQVNIFGIVVNMDELNQELAKYGFNLSFTVLDRKGLITNEKGKLYTIYKSLLHVKEEIRIKGLKELLL